MADIDWSQYAPGAGTVKNLFAGGLQAGSNILSNLGNAQGSAAYNAAIQGAIPGMNNTVTQGYNNLTAMTQPYMQQGQQGAAGLSQWSQQGPGTYGGVGSVQSFLDPSIAYQQQQVGKQLQAQTGNVGLSGSALKQLASKTQNVAQTGWNTAFNQQQQANQNQYQQFANNFQMKRQANLDNMQKFLQQLGQGQFGARLQANGNELQTQQLLGNQQLGAQAQATDDYTQTASPYNMMGSALGGLGQIFKV